MNDHDLYDVFHDTVLDAPPPMSAATVLTVARRARRRRHATWTGAGSLGAVAVVGLAAVAVPGGAVDVADSLRRPGALPTAEGSSLDGEEQEIVLLDHLLAALTEVGEDGAVPADSQEPLIEIVYGTGEARWYAANARLDGAVVGVVVLPADRQPSGETCGLPVPMSLPAPVFARDAVCEATGGDATASWEVFGPGADPAAGQWAVFRHADATLVAVRQNPEPVTAGAELPLSVEELAALAMDDRFAVRR